MLFVVRLYPTDHLYKRWNLSSSFRVFCPTRLLPQIMTRLKARDAPSVMEDKEVGGIWRHMLRLLFWKHWGVNSLQCELKRRLKSPKDENENSSVRSIISCTDFCVLTAVLPWHLHWHPMWKRQRCRQFPPRFQSCWSSPCSRLHAKWRSEKSVTVGVRGVTTHTNISGHLHNCDTSNNKIQQC